MREFLLLLILLLVICPVACLVQAIITGDYQLDIPLPFGYSFHIQPGWSNWILCSPDNLPCHANPFSVPLPVEEK